MLKLPQDFYIDPRRIRLIKTRPNSEDLIVFYQGFTILINAGMPISQALDIIAREIKSKYFEQVIKGITHDIYKNESLSIAMKKYPHIFDLYSINMIKAGEESGTLDIVLGHILNYLEKDIWKGVKICIPTYDNKGRPYRENKFRVIENLLKEVFGGVQVSTLTQGMWVDKKGKTYISEDEKVLFTRIKDTPEEKHYMECIRDLVLGVFRDQKEIEVEVTNIELWNQTRSQIKKG